MLRRYFCSSPPARARLYPCGPRCLPLAALLLLGCPELRSRTPVEDVDRYAEFVLVELLEGHPAPVTCVSWGELGTRLISGDAQGLAFIWDVNTPDAPRA